MGQTKKQQAEKHTTCDEDGTCIPSGVNLVPKRVTYFFDDEFKYLTAAQKSAYKHPTLLYHPQQWANGDAQAAADSLKNTTLDPVRSALGGVWIQNAGSADQGENGPKFFRTTGNSASPLLPQKIPFFNMKFESPNYSPITGESGITWIQTLSNAYMRGAHHEIFYIDYNLHPVSAGEGYLASVDIMNTFNDDDTPNRYVDFTSAIALPYEYNELENYTFLTAPLYVKTESRYNFHIPQYESIIGGTSYKMREGEGTYRIETLLPDLHSQVFDKLTGDKMESMQANGSIDKYNIINIYDLHSTLGGLVKGVFKDTVSKEGKTLKSDSKGQYFRKWSKVMTEFLDFEGQTAQDIRPEVRDRVVKLRDMWERKVFPAVSVKTISEYNDRKYLFPMYNEIEFSTDTNTSVADLLKEMRMDYSVLKYIAQGMNGDLINWPTDNARGNTNFAYWGTNPMPRDRIFLADDRGIRAHGTTKELYGSSTTKVVLPQITEMPTAAMSFRFFQNSGPTTENNFLSIYWNQGAAVYSPNITPIQSIESLDGALSSMPGLGKVIPYSDHAVMIDAYPEPTEISMTDHNNISNKFYKNLMLGIFRKRLFKIIKDKTRTYKQIMEGRPAYSETLCYSVEKWDVNEGGQPREKLQTTIFQNANDIDVIKYVDTQVVYNRKYIYKIKAWQVIFGSEISYDAKNHPEIIDALAPPQIPQSPTDLPEVDWFKRDAHLAAAELLGADVAQRTWQFNRSFTGYTGQDPTPGSAEDTASPTYEPTGGDFDILGSVACGKPLQHYHNDPHASAECLNLYHKTYGGPDESHKTMKGSDCCSHLSAFSDIKSYPYFKNVLGMPIATGQGASESLSGLLSLAKPEEFDFFGVTIYQDQNPVPLPDTMMEGFFKLNYRSKFSDGEEKYPDGFKDIRAWFSATLFSIVSRRVRYIFENSLLIGSNSLYPDGGSHHAALESEFSWYQNTPSSTKMNSVFKILGHEESWYHTVAENKINKGAFMKSLFDTYSEYGLSWFSDQYDSAPEAGTYNRWNKLDLVDAVFFLKTINFAKLRDHAAGDKWESIYEGYQAEASELEEIFQERLDTFLLEVSKYIKTGVADAEKIDDLKAQWEQYDNAEAAYNDELAQYAIDSEMLPAAGRLEIQTMVRPQIKIVEVPYYETSPMVVTDYPPIPPNVDIIPYKGVNNKVLINLSCNIGEYKAQPIILDNEQKLAVQNSYLQQYDFGTAVVTQPLLIWYMLNKPLTFRSDDMASQFDIWRIEKRPERYGDFKQHPSSFVQTIPTNGFSAVSFIDSNLKPNKKYYYTFRTKDSHNHFSNPTPVYRIELVETDGVIYFLMDIIEIKELEKKRKWKKSGRRYINIMPTLDQALLNENLSNIIGDSGEPIDAADSIVNPTLGIVDPALFNHDNPRTKFKVRLTSKSTGRKIDFNLKFKVENVKTRISQNYTGDPEDPFGDGQESS